jgi:hypothetical protein
MAFSVAGVRVKAGVAARRAWPLLGLRRSVFESLEGEVAPTTVVCYLSVRV